MGFHYVGSIALQPISFTRVGLKDFRSLAVRLFLRVSMFGTVTRYGHVGNFCLCAKFTRERRLEKTDCEREERADIHGHFIVACPGNQGQFGSLGGRKRTFLRVSEEACKCSGETGCRTGRQLHKIRAKRSSARLGHSGPPDLETRTWMDAFTNHDSMNGENNGRKDKEEGENEWNTGATKGELSIGQWL